jgi:DNA-binding CsgD family transcriptional regulator
MSVTVTRAKTLVLGEDVPWPALTRDEILAACREGVCPFCSRDSLHVVGHHLRYGHGVSADQVREHYGFMRKQSFSTPEFLARQAALTREMMRDPKRRAAACRALHENRRPMPKHRPQTVEQLHARDPAYLDGCRRWHAEHPEESREALRRGFAVSQARLGVLWHDEQWLDAKKRRFASATRSEIACRWQAGESVAGLARAYRANQRSISEILAEQGIAGEHGRRLRYHHYAFDANKEVEIVRRYLAGESRKTLAAEVGCSPGHISHLAAEHRKLTPREREVLTLLATGATFAQLALRLGIAAKTVSCVASIIYRKLAVRGRAAAVRRALELGLVECRPQDRPPRRLQEDPP